MAYCRKHMTHTDHHAGCPTCRQLKAMDKFTKELLKKPKKEIEAFLNKLGQ